MRKNISAASWKPSRRPLRQLKEQRDEEQMKALSITPQRAFLGKTEDVVIGPEDVKIAVKAVGICGSDVYGYLGLTGRRTPP